MNVSQVPAVPESVGQQTFKRPPGPGSLAVITTDKNTCMAMMQTDGSWREITRCAVVESVVSLDVLA